MVAAPGGRRCLDTLVRPRSRDDSVSDRPVHQPRHSCRFSHIHRPTPRAMKLHQTMPITRSDSGISGPNVMTAIPMTPAIAMIGVQPFELFLLLLATAHFFAALDTK